MKNKTVYKILSAIFIVCIVLSFFSCSQNNKKNDSGEDTEKIVNDANDAQNISETEIETPRILSEAPVNNYGGYNFRILSRLSQTPDHHWEAIDIVADEENGDTINDAVYKRNAIISEKYNIKISRTDNADPMALVTKSVKAGSDDFDLLFGPINTTVVAAQAGILINLKNVPYLDLSKPWYDQNANAQLSIGGKLYATFCDFTIMDKNATWVYLFNKQLIQDLQLDNPYQLVKDGQWTIDKMVEMCKGAAKDLDGDGVMTWKDQFGWQGESGNMYMGIVASGIQVVTKNKEDLPEYNGIGERGLEVFTKLLQVFGNKNISLRSDDLGSYKGDIWTEVMDASFMEGRILFDNAGMNRVTLFRSMDTDFGIIPSPKLDSQSDYCNSLSHHQATALSFPATVAEPEKSGVLADALCAESSYTVIPAYYDVQLKTKFARDDESGEMLDIIFASRRFDLSQIYDWGGLPTIFNSAMTKNDPNITSALEKAESKVIAAIGKTIAAYGKNEN